MTDGYKESLTSEKIAGTYSRAGIDVGNSDAVIRSHQRAVKKRKKRRVGKCKVMGHCSSLETSENNLVSSKLKYPCQFGCFRWPPPFPAPDDYKRLRS